MKKTDLSISGDDEEFFAEWPRIVAERDRELRRIANGHLRRNNNDPDKGLAGFCRDVLYRVPRPYSNDYALGVAFGRATAAYADPEDDGEKDARRFLEELSKLMPRAC